MTKSFADECLARANAATEGPWVHNARCDVRTVEQQLIMNSLLDKDAKFIAHAREDVPELARRLKKACDRLRELSAKRRDDEFIDELEAPLEGK